MHATNTAIANKTATAPALRVAWIALYMLIPLVVVAVAAVALALVMTLLPDRAEGRRAARERPPLSESVLRGGKFS